VTFRLVVHCLKKLRLHDHRNNVNYKVLKLFALLLLSRIVELVMVAKGKLLLFIFVYTILKSPVYFVEIYVYLMFVGNSPLG
jgi:hypothetical protein